MIGYPLANILGSYDVTVTRGIVSAVRANIGLIQVDAAMNAGVSGGPVMNARGDVVGIAVAGLRIGQQVNFAAPAAAMAAIMQRLVGRSVPELPALRIPFTTTREMSVTLQKGLPANTSRTELGAQCSPLPPEARAVTGVRGNLSVPGTLLVVVWLSMNRGAASNDRGAFGHMGVDGIPPPVFAPRTTVSLTSLDLPPGPVCINVLYRTDWICVNCQFEVRYAVLYRVREIPTP